MLIDHIFRNWSGISVSAGEGGTRTDSTVADRCRYLDSCVVRWVDSCGEQVRRVDMMVYRETFGNALYYDIYIDGLYLIFLCVAPLTTLIFMNVRLVQAIRYLPIASCRHQQLAQGRF